MTRRALNMFEAIFAILFILKITKSGIVSDWSWFLIFIPLVLNYVVKFFGWIYEGMKLQEIADEILEDKVRDYRKKSLLKTEIRKAKKNHRDSLKM